MSSDVEGALLKNAGNVAVFAATLNASSVQEHGHRKQSFR